MTTATGGQKVGRMAFSVEAAASTRARASTARPDTYCEYCGKRMSPGRHGRRRYCSNAHRTAAYKRRRRAAEKAAAVEG